MGSKSDHRLRWRLIAWVAIYFGGLIAVMAFGDLAGLGLWPLLVWTVAYVIVGVITEKVARSREWRRMRRDERTSRIVEAMTPKERDALVKGHDVDLAAIEARAAQVRQLKLAMEDAEATNRSRAIRS